MVGADLEKGIFQNKKRLHFLISKIFVEGMNNIPKHPILRRAFDIYEDVISQHIGSSTGTYISFEVDFNDEDFLAAAKKSSKRKIIRHSLARKSSYFSSEIIYEKSVAKNCKPAIKSKETKWEVTIKIRREDIRKPIHNCFKNNL